MLTLNDSRLYYGDKLARTEQGFIHPETAHLRHPILNDCERRDELPWMLQDVLFAGRLIGEGPNHMFLMDGSSVVFYANSDPGPEDLDKLKCLLDELGIDVIPETLTLGIQPGCGWTVIVWQEREFYQLHDVPSDQIQQAITKAFIC